MFQESSPNKAMPELKDRIPVLNDIVHRVVADQARVGGGAGRGAIPAPVLSEDTIEVLVDTLHREFLDRVTRSLHEAIAREEAGLRSAIRAHLEVTLPEVIARHGEDGPADGLRSRTPTSSLQPEPREPREAAPVRPARSQRRKLRLPRKPRGAAKASL